MGSQLQDSCRSMEPSEGDYPSETAPCGDGPQENQTVHGCYRKRAAKHRDDCQDRDMTNVYFPKHCHKENAAKVGKNCADDCNDSEERCAEDSQMTRARRRKVLSIDESQRCRGSVDCNSQGFYQGTNCRRIARPCKKASAQSASYRLYRHAVLRALNHARRRPIITRSITTMVTRSGRKYPNNQPNIYLFQLISSKARMQTTSQCNRMPIYSHHRGPQTPRQILRALKATGQKTNGSNSIHNYDSGDSAIDLNKTSPALDDDIAVKFLHNSPNYTSLLSLDIDNDADKMRLDCFKKLTLVQDLQNTHNQIQGYSKPSSQEKNCSPPQDIHCFSTLVTSSRGHNSSSFNTPSTPYSPVPLKDSPGQHPSFSPESLSPPYSPANMRYSSPSANPSQSSPSIDSPNWSPEADTSRDSAYWSPDIHSHSSPSHSSENPSASSHNPVRSSSSPVSSTYRPAPIQNPASPTVLSQSTPSKVTRFPSRPLSFKMSHPSSEGMRTCSDHSSREVSRPTNAYSPLGPFSPYFSDASPSHGHPIATKQAEYTRPGNKPSPLRCPKSPSLPSRPLSSAISSPSEQTCSGCRSHGVSSPANRWTRYQRPKNSILTTSAACFPPAYQSILTVHPPKETRNVSPSSKIRSLEPHNSLMAPLPCTTCFSRYHQSSPVRLEPSPTTLHQGCPHPFIMSQGKYCTDPSNSTAKQQRLLSRCTCPCWNEIMPRTVKARTSRMHCCSHQRPHKTFASSMASRCHPREGEKMCISHDDYSHWIEAVHERKSDTRNSMPHHGYFLEEEALAVSTTTRIRRIPPSGAENLGQQFPDEQQISEEARVAFSSDCQQRREDDLSRTVAEKHDTEPRFPASASRRKRPRPRLF